MATLNTTNIKHASSSTNSIVLANDGTCTANLKSISGGQLAGFRNLVINGNFKVHQRAQSVTGTSGGYVTADRFHLRESPSTTFNASVANGVLTCNSPAASTLFDIRHGIEWDDAFYGKTMTLSFNATSAVGGVVATVEVVDGAIASTTATHYAHLTGTTTDVNSYALTPVSGTRYEITVDIPADADVSFTPDMLRLRLGNATTDASQSFTLSNVQLEFGSVATEFEHRSFAQELALCQRYYFKGSGSQKYFGGMYNSSNSMIYVSLPVTMRSTPTITSANADGGTLGDIYENENNICYYILGDTAVGMTASNVEANAEL